MDELFGRDNFVATVIWEKTDSPRGWMPTTSRDAMTTILVYPRKSESFKIRRLADGEGVPGTTQR